MMQMKTKGKMPPGKVGPPLGEDVIDGRARQRRIGDDGADDSRAMVPILRKLEM